MEWLEELAGCRCTSAFLVTSFYTGAHLIMLFLPDLMRAPSTDLHCLMLLLPSGVQCQ